MSKVNGEEVFGVQSLLRTRESIIQQISDAENLMQSLVLQLTHVEATLKILRPEIAMTPVRKRPPLTRPHVRRGTHIRPIMAALHEATRPVTVWDLARAYLIAQGKPGIRVSKDAREIVRQVMRKLLRKGIVRVHGHDGPAQTWELVRD